MCGIVGIYHFKDSPISAQVLEQMTSSIAHRGPDDFGYAVFGKNGEVFTWKDETPPLINGNVAIGNRRLKIIDLSSAGHQPMTIAHDLLWLTYNGEIYNYIELRDELIREGYSFVSHTDSEVILNAYLAWGTNCFSKFNGMWALALYDRRNGSLVLTRDRWGVKPLYVYHDPHQMVFGSELKALFCHPAVPKKPEYFTIYNYVARHYRWVDGSRRTFFDGIQNLPPGHYWIFGKDGNFEEKRYWELKPQVTKGSENEDEVLSQFFDLFSDAVRIRLRSDVPVATMLSGGLDSSSVTCMAARLSSKPITAFSARYAEKEFDEGIYIESTINHVGADSKWIYPKPGELIGTLNEMLEYHDEPVCTVTWFAHWMVMREVAKMNFPVLLNGHVGDELFAGYWDHYLYNFVDLEETDPVAFEHEFNSWLTNHARNPDEYKQLKVRLNAFAQGRIQPADANSDYGSVVMPAIANYSTPPERPNPFNNRGHLTSRLYLELMYETVPATLRPEDRNSMAFSIETRSPFLDYRLVEFAFSLSNRFKIRDGLGKWLIREGMRGILPEPVRARKDKQGFNAPTAHWFKNENHDAVRSIFASKSLEQHGILNQQEILSRFDEHVRGRANHYQAIWQWLNLELWMRQEFDNLNNS